ncbi:MAG: NAD(P)/FAD-dependent oxidoreductase [Acidobacteriota bacterium]
MKSFDVAVIGGGPAGSTIGRLLTEWGYSVFIVCKPPGSGPSLAESLPPSIRKLFSFLGILSAIDQAGFYRTSGNTVWWGDAAGRVERFSGPASSWGYQVLRSDFDRLLLGLAREAGARVCSNGIVRHVDCHTGDLAHFEYGTAGGKKTQVTAKFILDCSGRAGVIARSQGLRKKGPGYNTLAVASFWQNDSGWKLEDETHTLVETYRDGWAWSVPLSPTMRCFTVMVDSRTTQLNRTSGLRSIYQSEIEKTKHFKRLLSGSTMKTAPWGCDASLYWAQSYARPQFLLVGDAASVVNPLSSYGVKKALASAWVGAVVVNTCLRRAEMREAALEFYSHREHEVYLSYLRQSLRYFEEAAAVHSHPFWMDRAQSRVDEDLWVADEEELKRDPKVLAAFDALKKSPCIRLRRGEGVSIEKKAAIAGREVVLEQALIGPGLPSGLRFLGGVDLPTLVGVGGEHSQVPDLFEAYNRIGSGVDLPNFLGALSVLLAKGILINQAEPENLSG